MKRSSIFPYGVLCYALSLVTFMYAFAFVALAAELARLRPRGTADESVARAGSGRA